MRSPAHREPGRDHGRHRHDPLRLAARQRERAQPVQELSGLPSSSCREPALHTEEDQQHRRARIVSAQPVELGVRLVPPRGRHQQAHHDRDVEVGADRAGSRNVREPRARLGDDLLDALDVQVARGRPDQVHDRPVPLLVFAGLDRRVDDREHLVGVGRDARGRALSEDVDAGVHLGERVADAAGDLDRLLCGLDRLRLLLQHLDLGEPSERAGQLRRLGQSVRARSRPRLRKRAPRPSGRRARQARERTPSASDRSWASSGPSLASAESR